MTLFISVINKVYPSHTVEIASLQVNKTPIIVHPEYSNFPDVCSPELVAEFLEYLEIKNHTIDLVVGKLPSYVPIYSLRLIKLETLKIYIKNNLTNSFITTSKLLTSALIVFIWKFDRSLCLCVDYQSFNYLTIKN